VSAETMAAARWESARWLLVGMGVIGAVFTVLPGKRAGSAVNFGDSRRKTS
jgi:hypothetical protein